MRKRSGVRFLLESVEGAMVLGSTLCTWPLLDKHFDDWGSRPEERNREWPGDKLLVGEFQARTRGIDIAAPADRVWRWLVQFGLGRAGFYSYELLERLVGIPVANGESIDPEFQSLEVGDEVFLHPDTPGIPVALLEPGRHICFGQQQSTASESSEQDQVRTWSLYLEPRGESCRLIVRSCFALGKHPSKAARLAASLEGPIDFVMEQRMLRSIKRLAEMEPATPQ